MDDVKPRGTHDLLPGDRIWISYRDGASPQGWAEYRGENVLAACGLVYDKSMYIHLCDEFDWYIRTHDGWTWAQLVERDDNYWCILEQLLGDGSLE